MAAYHLDGSELECVLNEAFAKGSFEFVVDDWLMPKLPVLGDEWGSGRIDIASEHFATNAIIRRMAATFEGAGRAKSRSLVFVGLPSDSYHEIGTLALATALRRRGMTPVYLGANVPTQAWTASILRQESAAAIVGVMTSSDIGSARDIVEAVISTSSQIFVAVGGPYVDKVGLDAVVLPPRITDAVAVLADRFGF